jgi:integrase
MTLAGPIHLWLPIVLWIYTGTRNAEGRHLRWEWIDWSSGRINLRRRAEFSIKRDKERHFPLLDELRAILQPMAKPHGWIIEDAEIRSRSPKVIWKRFRAYLEAGRNPGWRPHRPFDPAHLGLPDGRHRHRRLPTQALDGPRHARDHGGLSRSRRGPRPAIVGWPRGQFHLRSATPAAIAAASNNA